MWRPLHEASGGWFWWGVASPECYVQLYRLVFNRMVVDHKLTNLLWVWNINTDPKYGYDYSALNGEWYPGDEYVDVVAVDIYDPLLNHNSAANYYNKIINEVGTNKMIALSENGAIPDIDSIAEDKSYWSYWMTWSQTWSGNFLEKTTEEMWKRNLDDDRIIALDDMPGWDKYVPGSPLKITKPFFARRASGGVNVAIRNHQIELDISSNGRGNVGLYDMQGHLVRKYLSGNIVAQSYTFQTMGIAQGKYVLIVAVGSSRINKIVEIK